MAGQGVAELFPVSQVPPVQLPLDPSTLHDPHRPPSLKTTAAQLFTASEVGAGGENGHRLQIYIFFSLKKGSFSSSNCRTAFQCPLHKQRSRCVYELYTSVFAVAQLHAGSVRTLAPLP